MIEDKILHCKLLLHFPFCIFEKRGRTEKRRYDPVSGIQPFTKSIITWAVFGVQGLSLCHLIEESVLITGSSEILTKFELLSPS